MRISALKPMVMGTPWRNLTFVIVETDDGLRGVGEVRMVNHTDALLGYLQEAGRNHILGSDPFNIRSGPAHVPARLCPRQRVYDLGDRCGRASVLGCGVGGCVLHAHRAAQCVWSCGHSGSLTPGGVYAELQDPGAFQRLRRCWAKAAVTGLPEVDAADGCFPLPQGPGLGVTLNEDVVAAHPREQVFFDLFAENWQHRQARARTSGDDDAPHA